MVCPISASRCLIEHEDGGNSDKKTVHPSMFIQAVLAGDELLLRSGWLGNEGRI